VLTKGWHADHVVPYSKGGKTELSNGQALCAECNLSKGSGMESTAVNGFELRKWQEDAETEVMRLESEGKTRFLIQACPGAGKTGLFLYLAKQALSEGKCNKIIILCPTTNLKEQTKEVARKVFGLELKMSYELQHGELSSDYDGCLLCLQSLTQPGAAQRFRKFADGAYVIIDEVHHLSDDDMQSWGGSVKDAVEHAATVAMYTGTPFRSDGNPIPLVTYDDEGKCVADFECSYAYALEKGWCSPFEFYFHDGVVDGRFHNLDEGEFSEFRLRSKDTLSNKQEPLYLSGILDHSSEFMQNAIREAKERLAYVRTQKPDATGIVLCSEKSDADQMAQYFRNAVVVHGDADDPDGLLKAYKNGQYDWLIAVAMVSEGTDFPEAKVMLYAKNVRTDVAFRQAVFRVGRGEDTGHVILPNTDTFLSLAEGLVRERNEGLKAKQEREKREPSEKKSCVQCLVDSAEHDGSFVYTTNDKIFSREQHGQAEQLSPVVGEPTYSVLEKLPQLWELFPGMSTCVATTESVAVCDDPEIESKRLSTRVRKCANRIVKRCLSDSEYEPESRERYRFVHGMLGYGYPGPESRTVAQWREIQCRAEEWEKRMLQKQRKLTTAEARKLLP